MKLISLAAISFLAITVSAYPGLGTPSQGDNAPSAEQSQDATGQSEQQSQGATGQSEQQSQGATGQSEQQSQGAGAPSTLKHYEPELQAQIDMLSKNHREKINEIYNLGDHIKEMEDNLWELKRLIEDLEKDSPEKDDMMVKLMSLSSDIKDEFAFLQNKVEEMKEIEGQYNNAKGIWPY
ncbi:hypothetical protein BASA50_004359 [Batrachochytrium salamandrivorans]|uniref:Uncharacterized protein n=1 Tax=Batrachochytrium salamandrivorans TaxID=1357716 RepID=A0ABQ8FIL9_9FUNG|nr:hypothetical protein BASA50_004359 [Batrachochytrium salamandrivorans]KAH6602915.1 hypothetical protein BASA61_000631 [Batrachochytrium salamandrivorans]